jgi:hypothetical protein
MRNACDGCGNMTATMRDGRCETCGCPKAMTTRFRQRHKSFPWGGSLGLMVFAIMIAVVILTVERIMRPM